jgi:ketosteroid isomerase-like protein
MDLASAVLVAMTLTGAPEPSPWDAKATASMEAEARQMFADLDAGKFDEMGKKGSADIQVFDVDPTGKAVVYKGQDAVKKYFAEAMDGYKTKVIRSKSTVSKTDCHATATLGFCGVEATVDFTKAGQPVGDMKLRGTLIAHKTAAGWVWDHWHASLAEPVPPPEPMKPEPAKAPEPMKKK